MPVASPTKQKTFFVVLAAISFCHLLNDMVQSLIVAIYPNLQKSLHLNLAQFGLISLTYQVTASLLQPFVGIYTDKHPQPYSLPVGMGFTLSGMIVLSRAASFEMLLIGGALVGVGSSIFHPESSRIARVASGGQHGLAQSLFQVGGNGGSSLGPLLAALVVTPYGQGSVAWFAPAALLGIVIMLRIGHWYKSHIARKETAGMHEHEALGQHQPQDRLDFYVGAGGPDVFKVLLFGEPFELLHVLSNQEVQRFGGQFAAASISVSAFCGRGNDYRRPDWRPFRAAAGDLVFNSGRAAVYLAAAPLESLLDHGDDAYPSD